MAKILVVDDKPNMLTLLESILCKDGHEVVKAENGSEALRLYGEQGHIDLVISDLVMPQMDGRELFLQLKALNPSVPFVILTSFGTIKTAVEVTREGVFDFVTKSPFDRVGMRDIVKRALAQSGQPNKIGRLTPQVPAQSGFAGIIGKSHSQRRFTLTAPERTNPSLHWIVGPCLKPYWRVNSLGTSKGALQVRSALKKAYWSGLTAGLSSWMRSVIPLYPSRPSSSARCRKVRSDL